MAITVMAVDDEPAILDLFKAILEPLGCEVLAISDSREAVLLAGNRKLDGFFLDVRMPYVDGFELTETIRKSPTNSRAPIVMLTGLDDVETMRRGFKAGITFFLAKPVSTERLVSLYMAMRGPMMAEKRRYARLPFHSTVTCAWSTKNVKLSSLNISEGGMLLELTEAIEVGQEFDLEFSLPQVQGPLSVRAQVVRRHPKNGVGIKFLTLSAEDREVIQRYIMGAM